MSDARGRITVAGSGTPLSRLWICFGYEGIELDVREVVALMIAARTNVLPINTHRLTPGAGVDALVCGYGRANYERVLEQLPDPGVVPMLNINLARSADEAVDRTCRAADLTGIRVIKLEVLDETCKRSSQTAIIEATRALRSRRPELVCLPLLGPELEVATALTELGCPLLRVMGSPIGSSGGIARADEFASICSLGRPVLLDGGVGKAEDISEALALGAAGVLVNSRLYADRRAPVDVLQALIEPNTDALFGSSG